MVDAAISGEGKRGKKQRKTIPDRCRAEVIFRVPFCPRPCIQGRLTDCFIRPRFFAEFFAKLCAIGTPNHPMCTSILR
jgi:hypothetical protein